MKKIYEKPDMVVDTFLSYDDTNTLNYISKNIAPVSADLANKFSKLNS